jgi:hypothetical protein
MSWFPHKPDAPRHEVVAVRAPQPTRIQAFFLDRPRSAETPPKQMTAPAAGRRAAMTALLVPLLSVPAAKPACAGSIIDKIDDMICPGQN